MLDKRAERAIYEELQPVLANQTMVGGKALGLWGWRPRGYRPLPVEFLVAVAGEHDLNLGALLALKHVDEIKSRVVREDVRRKARATLRQGGPTDGPGGCNLRTWITGRRFIKRVVVGDRTERPAKDLVDILTHGSSYEEISYLLQLRAPDALLVSHRIMEELALERDLLREVFAGDLLTVGMPESSLLTRHVMVDGDALFVCKQPKRARDIEQFLRDRYAAQKPRRSRAADEPSGAQMVLDEAVKRFKPRQELWYQAFAPAHHVSEPLYDFTDPIHGLHDGATVAGRAVITLASNPYDPTSYALVAAGSKRWRTALTIRCLTHPEFFNDHPFGGVLDMSPSDALADRYRERLPISHARWVTPPYTAEEYLEAATASGMTKQAKLAKRLMGK